MTKSKSKVFSILVILSLLMSLWITPFGGFTPAMAATLPLVDDFESGLPTGLDPNGISIGFVLFQDPNSNVVTSTTNAPPAPVPGIPEPNNMLQMDLSVVSYAGFVHMFENEMVNEWVSQDWSAYEGISFWLYGNNSGTTMFVDVLDNRNPGSTTDDAERWSIDIIDNFSGWQEIQIPFASMHRKEIGNGAPNDGFGLTEVHGWALGAITTPAPQTYYVDQAMVYGEAPVLPLTVSFNAIDYKYTEGSTATVTAKLSKPYTETVTVDYATVFGFAVPDRDYTPTFGTLTFPPNTTLQSFTVQTIDDLKYQGELGVLLELSNPTGGATLGIPPIARLDILDNEAYDSTLIDDFETYPYLWKVDKKATLNNLEIAAGDPLALPGKGAYEHILQAQQINGMGTFNFSRTFAQAQDWSDLGGLSFWYYGQNSNKDVVVSLANNVVVSQDPAKWKMVWSDEFNNPAGSAPNSAVWGWEVGDGTVNGIPGWGNSELEYYTDGTANAATDGLGNLQISAKEADGSLTCYYGLCEHTSARLLTKDRFEIAYGRVEARIKVPAGSGLWPAFWMLGTDIDQVGWPQSGEIDIMEFVGREPNQVFGTLHGPDYSGGQSYGATYDLEVPVSDDFHVFAVEWQPDRITWLIDGIPYFTATPDDPFLQGKQWVFNHPFFVLLNLAVGGTFGGPVGDDTVFPANYYVDYVRLYQARQKVVSFKASFKDNFNGWSQVSIPFTAFTNDDGAVLDLSAVQSLSFRVPDKLSQPFRLDQIRLNCPQEMTVTSTADDGRGSLRKALGTVCVNGTVRFSSALAGQTITMLSAPLTLGKNVTIDASDAPGLTVGGNSTDRVFIVNAGTTATVKAMTIANGYGWQLAGGILNNGSLTLDHTTVTQNVIATNAGDFWQGGGGIYNGEWATLNLIDSSVTNNHAGWSGGGIYSYFNTTTTILRSTISGNVSNDVGGGIRSLGNMTITNSKISGNTATGWRSLHTDGRTRRRWRTSTAIDLRLRSAAGRPAADALGRFRAFLDQAAAG
jgi:beta-glucanase (GH16 family)